MHHFTIARQICKNFRDLLINRTILTAFSKFTIGFSSSISPTNWISGGFSVEQSIETGNDYECTVNRGESVCVWYKVAHTAYTVHNWQSDTCSNEKEYSDSYVMTSPNENNSGGGFYCVTGSACRSQSEGYWE